MTKYWAWCDRLKRRFRIETDETEIDEKDILIIEEIERNE